MLTVRIEALWWGIETRTTDMSRIRRAKIGDRVKWQSLDDTIPPEFGKIVELSPSGTRAEIEWDDGDTRSHDLAPWHPASCTRLVAK